MLVGVSGAARHGKDTVAQVLVEDFGFVRVGFADALKKLAIEVNPTIPGHGRLRSLVLDQGWEEAKVYPEVRRLLQDLGVGVREVIGPDAWVTAVSRTLQESLAKDIVIPDVRFPNEADFIHDQGGQLWLVNRVGFDNGVGLGHVSEQYVEQLPRDAELLNMDTLEQFKDLVREVAGHRLGRTPTWVD